MSNYSKHFFEIWY